MEQIVAVRQLHATDAAIRFIGKERCAFAVQMIPVRRMGPLVEV